MHAESRLPAMPQEIFSYASGQRRPVAVPHPAIPATPPPSAATTGRSWYRKAWVWVLASAILVIGLTIFLFREAGKWLVVEDSLQPSDVAVVLSGRMPDRAREAAELFRRGLVSEVWITRPADASAELRSLGIDFIGEPFYNQTVLIKL